MMWLYVRLVRASGTLQRRVARPNVRSGRCSIWTRCTNQHVEQANVGDSRHVAFSIPSMTQQTANDSMRAAKRSGIDTIVEGCAFSASPASNSKASMPSTSQTKVGTLKAQTEGCAQPPTTYSFDGIPDNKNAPKMLTARHGPSDATPRANGTIGPDDHRGLVAASVAGAALAAPAERSCFHVCFDSRSLDDVDVIGDPITKVMIATTIGYQRPA
jgi:hypothetical protein